MNSQAMPIFRVTLPYFFAFSWLTGFLVPLVSPRGVNVTLSVSIDQHGNTMQLHAIVGEDNLFKMSEDFAHKYQIYSGSGCNDDHHCVAKRLAWALTTEALIITGNAHSTLIADVPSPQSECGWHSDGDPFAHETPLSQARERSRKRTQPAYEELNRFAVNATLALDTLYAQEKGRPLASFEEDFDVLSVGGDSGGCCSESGSEPSLAIGIISGPGNFAHREAIRRTWLADQSLNDMVVWKFFIGIDLKNREDREKNEVTLQEALAFGDIALLNLEEHYLSTPKKVIAVFRWGVEKCGAYWVLRSNDDVYLRLKPTILLLSLHPPANTMMGLMIDGKQMTIPRPEHFGSTQADLYKERKVWAFSRSDYPSDTFPVFPQGNAIILSRDLAAEVASIARFPRFRLMADDVMIALVLARFNPIEVSIDADYEFEGKYTRCHNEALWHFNIHPEHMYDLYHNWRLNLLPCDGIDRFCCG
mmetsp:Transcript_40951/g.82628  ORF Transcript_40951/g.82628 Transcript_40951/m.82628 type:complete len:475 (-) Transcript_40951:406-1830(-)